MSTVSSKIIINAPVDTIYQVISDFGTAGQYLAGVVQCTVEGTGVGALRTLTSADARALRARTKAKSRAAT